MKMIITAGKAASAPGALTRLICFYAASGVTHRADQRRALVDRHTPVDAVFVGRPKRVL